VWVWNASRRIRRRSQGRFSKGEEALPEEDPEKHVERRFSEGVEASYPMGGSEAA
jgi:hypothetical protein